MNRRGLWIVLLILCAVYAALGWRLIGFESASAPQLLAWLALLIPFALIAWLPLYFWSSDDTEVHPWEERVQVLSYLSMSWLSFTLLLSPLPRVWIVPGTFVLLALAYWGARRLPKVREQSISLPQSHQQWSGLKIAHLSDLHIRPGFGASKVRAIVDQVLALKPDLICMTGDMGDAKPSVCTAALKELARLSAKHGVYYVTGNHEYYWGGVEWVSAMREHGFIALVNESRLLNAPEQAPPLAVCGITDVWSDRVAPDHKSDLHAPIQPLSKETLSILLSHQPSVADRAAQAGYWLQLSGHTHGGQFVPWAWVIGFFHRYPRGLYRVGGMHLYVSCGTGYWGPPSRLGAPSEIAMIQLV